MKAVRLLAATTLAFSSLFISQPAHASCVSFQESQTIAALNTATSESVIRTIETCGGDDTSYQVPITASVTFDGQQFTSVYATTNSVITFGRPDNTYWDYPTTPSISLYSMDWVVFPNRGDEHLIIQTSDGGFRVDISARPYGMWNYVGIAPTSIIITAAINSDGTVAIAYALSGPEYQSRTGVRLLDGSIVTLQDYGIVQVAEPVVLTPEPVQPTPEPSPEPTPTPEPVSPPTYEPAPVEEIVVPTPEATPIEELPDPAPIEEMEPTPEPSVDPTPDPEPLAPVVEQVEPELPVLDPDLLDPETMTDEEVAELTLVAEETLLTAEPGSGAYQEALAQLMVVAQADDPEVSEALAAIPLLGDAAVAVLDAFNAVGNIGADIAPEVREKAQEVVVSSVIVGQIAATASIAAVGTSYRRIK